MKYNSLFFLLILFLLQSCTGNPSNHEYESADSTAAMIETSVFFDGRFVHIEGNDEGQSNTYHVKYESDNNTGNTFVTGILPIDIDITDWFIQVIFDRIHTGKDLSDMSVRISVNEAPWIEIKASNSRLEKSKPSVSSVIGNCLPLYQIGNDEEIRQIIRKWLYRNGHSDDWSSVAEIIENTVWSFQQGSNIWKPNTGKQIPIVKNLTGLSYSINSDIHADYYYLFATDRQEDIAKFIEEVVSMDYPESSKTTQGLSCFRSNDRGGVLGIFLIALNNDWSTKVIPVGLIAIDNILPSVTTDNGGRFGGLFGESPFEKSLSIHLSKYGINIFIPKENNPLIEGYLHLGTNQFRGDAAQFEVHFGGDIESISIKREVHRDYQRFFMKPETKTFKLSDKTSPFHFSYTLDIGIGDNFIPIVVKDKMGNEKTINYKITMESVNDDNPQINIDNNITIWED